MRGFVAVADTLGDAVKPAYHGYRKVSAGPGGIRCPCCNNGHRGHSQKFTKTLINRAMRRKHRIEVTP